MPMKLPKNILVIIDPTAMIHPSIDKAAILAAAFEARLEFFICDGDKPAMLDSEILDWGTALTEHLHGELHAVHAYLPEIPAASDNSAPLISADVFEQE